MSPKVMSTDVLSQDPEAFESYFERTAAESKAYYSRLKRIQKFWHDWPKQEAKNRINKKRLSRLKRVKN